MNFDEAIQAHAAWKIKLLVYVRKPDGVLKPSEVEAINRCELGKWLESEGHKYESLPEYKSLAAEHKRFHAAAAHVIKAADAGEKIDEDRLLGRDSEYGIASQRVVNAITALKNKVAHAAQESF